MENAVRQILFVSHKIQRFYDQYFLDLGLTGTQAMLLCSLLRKETERPSLAELGEAFHVRPASICRIIKALEKAGYLDKERADCDNRRKHTTLTAKTMQIRREIEQRMESANGHLKQNISDEDAAQLERILAKILER